MCHAVPLCGAQGLIASDGLLGLMGRGLKTKILANGLQASRGEGRGRWLQACMLA